MSIFHTDRTTKRICFLALNEKIIITVIVIFILTGFTGWVKNVVKLSECDFKYPYKAEVIHSLGLFPPIGAITGYLNVGK